MVTKTFLSGISAAVLTFAFLLSASTTLPSLSQNENTTNSVDVPQTTSFSEEIKLIQDAIGSINNDDTNQAKKLLIQAEGLMEDMQDKTAEKRVEAAIKMVKEGNKDSAIMHANEAIKLLQP
jgi:hypothetical protein